MASTSTVGRIVAPTAGETELWKRGVMCLYTLAEARYVLSHVYCVWCVPEDSEAGFSRPWFAWVGLAECCRCPCVETADLRLWVASESAAREWLVKETPQ